MSINVIFFKPSIQPIVFLMTRSFESAAQQLSLSLSLSVLSLGAQDACASRQRTREFHSREARVANYYD